MPILLELLSLECFFLVVLWSTVSTTTHKKSTTSPSTNIQHVTKLMSTSPSANSQSVMCVDKPMCSDTHFRQMACNDLYLSTTYCPRLCNICGRQFFSMIYVEQLKPSISFFKNAFQLKWVVVC